MTVRPFADLESKPALLADSVGWIALAAPMLCAAPITWLIDLVWGPLGWPATAAPWLGWLVIYAWCGQKWGKVPIDRLIAWVDRGLPTPDALQPGYLWFLKRPWVFKLLLALLFVTAPFWHEWRASQDHVSAALPDPAELSAIFLDTLLFVSGGYFALLAFLSLITTVTLRSKRGGST